MSLINIFDAITVDDLTALKALSATGLGKQKRINGDIRFVSSPGNSLSSQMYIYFQASSSTEKLPGIISPDDNIGRWIMLNPIFIDTAVPANPPQFSNSTWIANLTSPTRTVVYKTNILSTPSVLEDWLPVKEENLIAIDPTFAPDYIGQIVKNTTTGYRYISDDLSANASSWMPLQIIPGGNFSTKTITISDRNFHYLIDSNTTATLPGNLTKNISLNFTVINPSATLTLVTDSGTAASLVSKGTSLTGVGSSCKINNETGIWYASGDLT